ncbi:uncharacterized protein LOC119448598 [Dermacentor silvarum]|uniref:uncharacterized protein LOC119448598 n=1 Tax=Dermacentor silvarum TaxID=543639 RepID=UPI0018992850|nr:uncharacterized protein LOC119448598 [Dermacentor silvarum]
MKAAIFPKLLLLMCLRGAQSQGKDPNLAFDCAKGELLSTSTTHSLGTGAPDAATFTITITGAAAPYDVTLTGKTATVKFVEAYVGVYLEGKMFIPGTTVAATAPVMSGKCTSAAKESNFAYVVSTTDLSEMKFKFTPSADLAKDADKKVVASGIVCLKATGTPAKTPCSAPIMSAVFTVKKPAGGPAPVGPANPESPQAPQPPNGAPDAPPSAPHGSSPNSALRRKATDSLPTVFMVPSLVTLLIIIALKQFPVFPYAFITMY